MSYAYGTRGTPAVGGGLPGLPRRGESGGIPAGEYLYEAGAPDTLTIPAGVYQVSAVIIGPGQPGPSLGGLFRGGNGGGLRWASEIPVNPGDTLKFALAVSRSSISLNGVELFYTADRSGSAFGYAAPGVFVYGGDGGLGVNDATYGGGSGGAGGYFGAGGNAVSGSNGRGQAGALNSGAAGAGASNSGSRGGGVGPYGVLSKESPTTGGISEIPGGGYSTFGKNGEGVIGGRIFGYGPQRALTDPSPGCIRVIWGTGRSFPYNAGPLT